MATKKWKIEVQNSLNPWGSVHIFNDQNCTIATVFNTPPWEEVNGNAQMIAKAPDMLAMLRELLESDDALLQSDLYSRVESLVKKAGGSPANGEILRSPG